MVCSECKFTSFMYEKMECVECYIGRRIKLGCVKHDYDDEYDSMLQ